MTDVASAARDLPRGTPAPRGASSRLHLLAAAAVGVVVGGLAVRSGATVWAPLLGWDAAVVVYLVLVWRTVHGADAERTAQLAVVEKPGRGAADTVLLAAAVGSVGAVVAVLVSAPQAPQGVGKALAAGGAVVSVALSWVLVHVVHTLTYARLYYSGTDGGVDFNDDEPPAFGDFAYLSFTIGMTFQVSDTSLTSAAFRRVALRHALLSYLLGAVVIATTINLVAGLDG